MTRAAPESSSSDNAIPEGWVRRSLGELGAFSNGINKPEEAFGKGHAFVNLLDVFGFPEINSTDECGLVASTNGEKSRYSLFRGDVLFVRSSVKPSGVGLTTLVTHDLPGAVYSGFLLRFRNRGGLDLVFKRYCFHAEYFRNALIANSTVSANTNINQGALKRLSLLFPSSLIEQNRIGSALKDIDDLIASLDALIAKKRDIKQAAMQQLLTGKTRLAGFEGDWVSQALGGLSKIKTGSKNNQDKSEDGSFPFFVRSATVERISTSSYDCEAILVPGEGGIGSIFHYMFGKFDAHQRVYVINDFNGIDGRFLYYQMAMSFGAYAMQNSVKATVDSLRLPTFQTFEVHMPVSIDEQKAIAGALDAFVDEISALDARRGKIIALKEGMMQQLLTGRIRLV